MHKSTVVAAVLLTALTTLAGCSGDDGADGSKGPDGDGGAERSVATELSLGTVSGTLGKPRRKQVLREVGEVVDRWLDAAFVDGDYPRSDFDDAFPGFTDGAAALAARQAALSNARVGDRVEDVRVTERTVTVDVLAPGRRPAGATARVDLVMDLTGDVDRTDRIRGRVTLTPTKKGWRVFGFDLDRNRVGGRR